MTVMPARNFVSGKSPAQLRYAAYLIGYRWRWYVRPARLRIDGYACVLCSSTERLEVHHSPEAYKYRGRGPNEGEWYKWFGDSLDIITDLWRVLREIQKTKTLCHKCHSKHHGKYV